MPRLEDDDFKPIRVEPNIPVGKPRRGNRQARLAMDPNVSKEQVARAVTYLEEAEAGARELTDEVRKFAAACYAMLTSGLTLNAVTLLVQDLMEKRSGGSAHGQPKYSKETVAAVLKAAARLDEHLKETKA